MLFEGLNIIVRIVFIFFAILAPIAVSGRRYSSKLKRETITYYLVHEPNSISELVSRAGGIEIAGHKRGHLTLTYIIFWNAGDRTIKEYDISKIDPLAVYLRQGCIILNARIIHRRREANNYLLATEGRRCVLYFDYMEPGTERSFKLFILAQKETLAFTEPSEVGVNPN